MTDLIRNFWDGRPPGQPVLECARCGGPILARDAVAVIVEGRLGDEWDGWAHDGKCPE